MIKGMMAGFIRLGRQVCRFQASFAGGDGKLRIGRAEIYGVIRGAGGGMQLSVASMGDRE